MNIRWYEMKELLKWAASVAGPVAIEDDGVRGYTGRTHIACRLRTEQGICYLKTHRAPDFWEREVHAYEHWAHVFGQRAPKLLGVKDTEPRAILISALDGVSQEDSPLPYQAQKAVWRTAGEALRGMHEMSSGTFFGSCRRDGSSLGSPVHDAEEFVRSSLEHQREEGERTGLLSPQEMATLNRAMQRTSVFTGEHPVPCHRDYHPVNWLAEPDGTWTGVIDFEFSRWDVRTNDFARYPDWEWELRPHLVDALLEGYGRPLTEEEKQQILVLRVSYAVTAILMGHQSSMFGWEREGRRAMRYLAAMV